MIALDSSVVVAGFGPWHEHHAVAREVMAAEPRLPAHVGLEVYSVLTRLPEPFRAEAQLVADFLRRSFPGSRLSLRAGALASLPIRLTGLGVSGGAVYDALVALTADAAGAELISLDRRAMASYERCGVRARVLG